MKPEIMWAINGSYGLYVGTALTRREMIRFHCQHFNPKYPERCSDKEIKKIWRKRRKHGDRAVKVEIRILEQRKEG